MRKDILNKIVYGICFLLMPFISNAQDGIINGKVSNETEILPGATISVGSKLTTTDLKGEFVLALKPGTYKIIVTHAGYLRIEKEITVSAGVAPSMNFVLQPLDNLPDVIVLGSRSQKERSNLNTPVPIDRIRISNLPARQVELTKVLINTIPSFNAAAHGFGSGKHILPASLRGLGPDQTLVLLNGKRLHNIASPWTQGATGFGTVGVDLNTIPSSAIETIEVLRDGASAQYGSDAIAGVVSLKLKKSTGITSIDLHTGQYYKGDGEAFSFSINHGISILKKGHLNITFQSRFNNYTQRNGIYDSTVYYNFPSNATVAQKDIIRSFDEQKIAERGFDRANLRPVGDNRIWSTSFAMNGGYPINKKTNLFWTTVWNYRSVKDRSSSLYRFPKDSLRQVNTRLFPDGFLPALESKIPDVSIIGGIDGLTNSGWRWDASISYGKNSNSMTATNSNNATQFAQGVNAPTKFYLGKQSFSQMINNINISRELLINAKTIRSVNLSFGAEFRTDHYSLKEGEEASWKNYAPTSGRVGGSQGQAGFQPQNAVNKNRQVIGGYVEFEMEKNEKLLLNLAGRYEYYSDYGSNLAGKLALRYKFSKHILWRASISNGFRAPALQQRFYSLITTQSRPGGELFRTGTFRNDSKVAEAFGISPLHAERSINFSTGFTSAISKNISITVDAYWIQIKNRIIYSGTILDTFPEVRKILDSFGFKDVQNVRFFSNAINTRTIGLDIVVSGNWLIDRSTLEVFLATNLNKTSLYGFIQYAKNLPDNEKFRNLLVNREERCRVETAYPRDKIILNISYRKDKWGFHSSFMRYGRVFQKGNAPNISPDEEFSPKIVSAMNISYNFRSWLSLTVGAENITDVYPDKLKHKSNTSNGITPYNGNFAAFGFNGGYYFMNMVINLAYKK